MVHTLSLSERYRTIASNGRHELVADAPVEKGGRGAGFSAHELLEAALAVCVNMAVRMYAAQHGIPLESATTRVKLERPDQGTVRFGYELTLAGPLTVAQRRELLQAARACPIHETLSKRIEFHAMC